MSHKGLIKKLVSGAFAVATLASTAQSQWVSLPTKPITFGNIQASGTGCPTRDSYFVSYSSDKQMFSIFFNDFIVEMDATTTSRDHRKKCHIAIPVDIPAGIQWSIAKVDTFGWYDLGPNVNLEQTSSYHFQGGQVYSARSTYQGGRNGKYDDFHEEDIFGLLSWSPCGAKPNLIVDATLKLTNRNRRNPEPMGAGGIDSIEGDFDEQVRYGYKYYMQFQNCYN